MSGGGNKKKPTRTQGWEEAGSEFYQESYPTDAEAEMFQRDPRHLTTLLPSKQTRAAVATIRIKSSDNRTLRSLRSLTATRSRRGSNAPHRASVVGDGQDSMMPDLSEDFSNEESAWEEIMQIKALPISMAQKKEMKLKIQNTPKLVPQGYEQFKWKRRKMWVRSRSHVQEFYAKMELWRKHLKNIEGNFGTGVVAYFLFLKWLFLLNTVIFSIMFIFVTLPNVLLEDDKAGNSTNCSSNTCCSNITTSSTFNVLDLVQGTGIMEPTVLFYGFYSNNTLNFASDVDERYYNLPLAYLSITLAYFLISLIAVIRSAVKGFRERIVEGEGQYYQYCNIIFGGWDFCIHSQKAAAIKHKTLYREIKTTLETEKLEEERQTRSQNERTKLLITRFIVNIIVLIILAAGGCAIYFVFKFSTNKVNVEGEFEQFFYQFLPSLTIVGLNMVVPFIFRFLINFENYNPIIVIRLTLVRTVLLRLASLVVLYASLLEKITCTGSTCHKCCWETFVGQQIYKLVLTDFATHIIITFLVNYPRAFLANHINNKFFKMLGDQSFDLPKHVLDVVYSQTLCWFGLFFAPMLSAIMSVLFFLMFYIKMFACLVNSKPSTIMYRASRSNSMFMAVLLISYVFAVLPIAYTISELEPSNDCGPFRSRDFVWDLVIQSFGDLPEWIQSTAFFLSTAGFAIPLLIILIITLYYYTAVNAANRHMVIVLKNQLVLEGHDKQFLLDRLNMFLKQENNKRRLAE